MFTLTKALKQHMVEKHGLAADASDADASALVDKKFEAGELKLETIKQLTAAAPSEGEKRVREIVTEEIGKSLAPVNETMSKILAAVQQPAGGNATATKALDLSGATASGDASDPAKALVAGNLGLQAAGGDGAGAEIPGLNIRLKSVVEQFAHKPSAATYAQSPNPYLKESFGYKHLQLGGVGGSEMYRAGDVEPRNIDNPTQRSKAIAGAWFKHLINKQFRGAPPAEYAMTELDRRLVEYAVHECKFVGPLRHKESTDEALAWFRGDAKIGNEMFRKALLDDTASGGLEAVPIEFDDAVIITPLLTGQFFPLVTVRNVTRRRIEAASVGNPTWAWGTAEGSEISLFDTDSFISAFDTTIYPITGAIEHGLDFAADSPIAIGDIIINRYGEGFQREMDKAIATGSGTNQPTGFFNATAGATISATNTTTGPPTVSDYMGLLFGVPAEYRLAAGQRAVFAGTETAYQRARNIQVDSSNDQRLVFGQDVEDYRLLGHPYRLAVGASNGNIGFVCLNYYRFYRRAGFEVRVTREGKELTRRNTELIVVRARVGGQLELSGAFAETTNGQT